MAFPEHFLDAGCIFPELVFVYPEQDDALSVMEDLGKEVEFVEQVRSIHTPQQVIASLEGNIPGVVSARMILLAMF